MIIISSSDDPHHFFTSFNEASDTNNDHEITRILCRSWMSNIGTLLKSDEYGNKQITNQ